MPILGDLHKLLEANPLTQRLAIIVSRFVTGSAQSFNQQTNVNLENKYVVIDISELKGKLLPVGMFIGLDYIWDQVKSDRTKRKAIYIDEIWQLIGASSNRQAGEFCQEIFKIARGYGAAAIAASQDLSDFFSLEDGKYGRAIINNSKTKIILNLEPDEAEYVRETLKLTRTEIRSITQFERGEALISSITTKCRCWCAPPRWSSSSLQPTGPSSLPFSRSGSKRRRRIQRIMRFQKNKTYSRKRLMIRAFSTMAAFIENA